MKDPAAVKRIFAALERHHPGADTELVHRNAYELLVATMLSAQSTDARVNLVTPTLFDRFPDARTLLKADPAELERLILSTGFFRQKTRSLLGMAEIVVNQHGGEIPRTMEELTALPGVGRKTANVVLGHALGVPGFPVDRHVLRVAGRIGLIHTDDAVKAEAQLCALVPKKRWTQSSDELILHGRRVCRPKPLCPRCHVRPDCAFFLTGAVTKSNTKSTKKPSIKKSKAARRTKDKRR